MDEDEDTKCYACGAEANDPIEIEIFHRGCRFKAMFPEASKERDGLLFFDPKKMGEVLNRANDTSEQEERA